MPVRDSLTTLIVALFVGLVPIPALAVGIGGGTAEISGVNLILTFVNDNSFPEVSDQDIIEIILYGGTAHEGAITWTSAGFPIDPPGVVSSIAGEGTTQVTVTFTPAPSEGFNPGESFVLFGVDADPGVPLLADLIGITVEFNFEDTSKWVGTFEADIPGNPEAGLTLAPEPETALLLALGLSGLAMMGRRRA